MIDEVRTGTYRQLFHPEQLSARQLQVEGKLVGNIQVVGCFEIMPGGQFRGEFKVGELKVHPGAVCEGKGKVLGLVDGVAQPPEGPSSP